jgi:hypothetical protein
VRTFADDAGRGWDVVAGRESWGAIVAIFVPRAGQAEVRQAILEATSYGEAEAVLGALDEARLRELLRDSEPKSP